MHVSTKNKHSTAGYNDPAVNVLTETLDGGYPTPIVAACAEGLNWKSFSTTVAKTTSEADVNMRLTLGDIPRVQVMTARQQM
jgi:hypothetical protein